MSDSVNAPVIVPVKILVPLEFTRADVDVLRAKQSAYRSAASEARNAISYIDALSRELRIILASAREDLANYAAMYAAKCDNQQASIDACVNAGVDR